MPYELVSDENLVFVEALELPTMDWEGEKLVKRITMVVSGGKIINI